MDERVFSRIFNPEQTEPYAKQPSLNRDRRGRVIWKIPGNSNEQNEQLAKSNLQALFLAQFPEFGGMFERGVDGMIIDSKRNAAKEYILEKLPDNKAFTKVFGTSPLNAQQYPYFLGSYVVAIQESFLGWGIAFNNESHLPRDNRGRIHWKRLRSNSEHRSELLEEEARLLMEKGIHISLDGLLEAGMYDFWNAVNQFYPGKINALKEKLGITSRKRKNFTTLVTSPEKGLPRYDNGDFSPASLKDDPEQLKRRIEEEALKILENGINLTVAELRKNNLSGFHSAVNDYYPGKLSALKDFFSLFHQRPPDYWKNTSNLEAESEKLVKAGCNLMPRELAAIGMGMILVAANKYYPGKIYALRKKFGLTNPVREHGFYRNIDTIEAEILTFIEEGNRLTTENLKKAKRFGLLRAIQDIYPGGYIAIREKFGDSYYQKPFKFWENIENIRSEARRLVAEGYRLSDRDLRNGNSAFLPAVRKNFPGGFSALKEEMGLLADGTVPCSPILPDQANEQLEKLLEKT